MATDTPNNKKNPEKNRPNHYRLVVLNDDTFEEKYSFQLSRYNIYMWLSVGIVLLGIVVLITASLLIFTPLKYYIPGYGENAKVLAELKAQSDSLVEQTQMQTQYYNNVLAILKGDIDTLANQLSTTTGAQYDTIDLEGIPPVDRQLREEVETEAQYSLVDKNEMGGSMGNKALTDIHFFPPMTGVVSNNFNPAGGHYGIDVLGPLGTPIKATLDGTVISTSWTIETGYVIAIQHSNDLVSFYKHNQRLLKKVGNFVKAGEVIAFLGNTGELSSGPHLHFELWHRGIAVNPENYVIF